MPKDNSLVELKQAFIENQLPGLEHDLKVFLETHPVLGDLPPIEREETARMTAFYLLATIRAKSIVRLVR